MTAALSNAYLWSTPLNHLELFSPPRASYDLWYEREVEPRQPSPYWTASTDGYNLKMRLPDVEPQTVSAQLAADGETIEVAGERKIEGCSCRPSTVKQVKLPYRPRAEDVDVTMKDGVLSLTLARHAKADAATPLKVNLPEEPKQEKEGDEPQTRPLRFVPHESAVETSPPSVDLDAQEKRLADKFRSAALASLATSLPSGEQAVAGAATDKTTATEAATAAGVDEPAAAAEMPAKSTGDATGS